MKLKKLTLAILTGTTLLAGTSVANAAEVEVLHYWTAGGEAKSVAELKKMMEAKGVAWKDFAVAGGAGENAMTALKARVIAGSAPTAALIKGPSIRNGVMKAFWPTSTPQRLKVNGKPPYHQ